LKDDPDKNRVDGRNNLRSFLTSVRPDVALIRLTALRAGMGAAAPSVAPVLQFGDVFVELDPPGLYKGFFGLCDPRLEVRVFFVPVQELLDGRLLDGEVRRFQFTTLESYDYVCIVNKERLVRVRFFLREQVHGLCDFKRPAYPGDVDPRR